MDGDVINEMVTSGTSVSGKGKDDVSENNEGSSVASSSALVWKEVDTDNSMQSSASNELEQTQPEIHSPISKMDLITEVINLTIFFSSKCPN